MTAEKNRANPLARQYGRRLGPLLRTLDDVRDEYRWRTAARFDRIRRQFAGAGHRLMVLLRHSSSIVRLFGIGRPGRHFIELERLHVRRLQRVLAAFDRQQETVSAWRAASAADPPEVNQFVGRQGITPRELAVLSLFADGLNLSAAVRRLGISPRTVAKHQENLQRKLATSDRLTTVLRAQRLGLVPAETARGA